MANQELELNAELLAKVNRELDLFGRLLPETEQELLDANTGIKNFSLKLSVAAAGANAIAGAFTSYTKAMYDGKRGASAFNDSLDEMATAAQAAAAGLALLVPGGIVMKGAIAGIGLLAGQLIKLGKTANDQSDALFKAFKGLSQTGATAGDWLTVMFEGLQKMGLGIQQVDHYIQLMTENAQGLALYGGTVAQGRKQFENLVEDMKPFRSEIRAMGLEQEEQNQAAIAYVKTLTRLNAQTKDNSNITGEAARAYIREMNELERVTGQTRKQAEDALDEAMRNQRFAARVDEVRAEQGEAAARMLQKGFQIANAAGKDVGAAFQDIASGFYNTEAATKGLMSGQEKFGDVIEQISAGQIKDNKQLAQSMQGLFQRIGETTTGMRGLARLGGLDQSFIRYSDGMNAARMATKDFGTQMEEAAAEIDDLTDAQGEGQEKLLKDQIRMRNAQQDAMLDEQRTLQQTLGLTTRKAADAAEAHAKLAKTALKAAIALGKVAGEGDEQVEAQDQMNRSQMTASEKLESYSAGAVESVGKLLGKGLKIINTEAGQYVEQMSEEARKSRMQSETGYLQEKGRFQMAPPVGGGQQGAASAPSTTSTARGGAGGNTVAPGAAVAVVAAGPGFTTIETNTGERQRREGARNWRNNNPGNIEYGNFAINQGAIGSDGRFAVFPTLAAGEKAKEELLFGANSRYIGLSIADAISRYAPAIENNTPGYISHVAKSVGVDPSTRMGDLNAGQRRSLLDAINKAEGFKEGRVVAAADGGVIQPRPGGTMVRAGEAGVAEAFIPLKHGKVPVAVPQLDQLNQNLNTLVIGRLKEPDFNEWSENVNSTMQEQSRITQTLGDRGLAGSMLLDRMVPGPSKILNTFETLTAAEMSVAEKLTSIAAALNPTVRVASIIYDTIKAVRKPEVDKDTATAATDSGLTPDQNTNIKVDMTEIVSALNASTEQNQELVNLVSQMVREQKNGNEINQKILQHAN